MPQHAQRVAAIVVRFGKERVDGQRAVCAGQRIEGALEIKQGAAAVVVGGSESRVHGQDCIVVGQCLGQAPEFHQQVGAKQPGIGEAGRQLQCTAQAVDGGFALSGCHQRARQVGMRHWLPRVVKERLPDQIDAGSDAILLQGDEAEHVQGVRVSGVAAKDLSIQSRGQIQLPALVQRGRGAKLLGGRVA